MKITVLGSGTSQGVPVIACACEVCQSTDPLDNRTRCSVLLEINHENYVIDTGPDFRTQMLREKVQSLRAVLLTHEHKDHIAGLDDVRAFNFKEGRDMEIYCSNRVETALKREFHYAFSDVRYPGVPKLNLNIIDNSEFRLPCGTVVQPIEVMHYKLPVHGFRIGKFAYVTDAKTVSTEERAKLRELDILIINALHRSEHISHFNLAEALEFIADIQPKKAYLTHISHLFGKHREIQQELPTGVFLAYDGLQLEIDEN